MNNKSPLNAASAATAVAIAFSVITAASSSSSSGIVVFASPLPQTAASALVTDPLSSGTPLLPQATAIDNDPATSSLTNETSLAEAIEALSDIDASDIVAHAVVNVQRRQASTTTTTTGGVVGGLCSIM